MNSNGTLYWEILHEIVTPLQRCLKWDKHDWHFTCVSPGYIDLSIILREKKSARNAWSPLYCIWNKSVLFFQRSTVFNMTLLYTQEEPSSYSINGVIDCKDVGRIWKKKDLVFCLKWSNTGIHGLKNRKQLQNGRAVTVTLNSRYRTNHCL
jgi:hypothetical protein